MSWICSLSVCHAPASKQSCTISVTAFLVPATSPICLICFSTLSSASIFASKLPPPPSPCKTSNRPNYIQQRDPQSVRRKGEFAEAERELGGVIDCLPFWRKRFNRVRDFSSNRRKAKNPRERKEGEIWEFWVSWNLFYLELSWSLSANLFSDNNNLIINIKIITINL